MSDAGYRPPLNSLTCCAWGVTSAEDSNELRGSFALRLLAEDISLRTRCRGLLFGCIDLLFGGGCLALDKLGHSLGGALLEESLEEHRPNGRDANHEHDYVG
jgi:hypothetical protein